MPADSLSPTVPTEEPPRTLEPALRPRPKTNETVETLKTIGFALVIVLALRIMLFQPFTIPSGSMIPNLQIGDYIVVSKFDYGYSRFSIPLNPKLFQGRLLNRLPHRGDIVVFKFPGNTQVDYVKRLIGLPGDRVQMMDNRLYVNDALVPDAWLPRTAEDLTTGVTRAMETAPGGRSYMIQDMGPGAMTDNTRLFLVPPHSYFMMGDNRDNSSDSRVDPTIGGVGFVPEENLEGRARIILFSWGEGVSPYKPWTWVTAARLNRFFHVLT
jgi:signal peptidase I